VQDFIAKTSALKTIIARLHISHQTYPNIRYNIGTFILIISFSITFSITSSTVETFMQEYITFVG